MDKSDYKELFQKLMPSGPAWARDPNTNMDKLAEALGDFFNYIGQRLEKTNSEMFPEKCDECLIDWEKMLELPEPCEHEGYHASDQTRAERINAVISKINRSFIPTEQNFEKLAKQIGYDVSITTTPPSRCGLTRCGDKLGGNIAASFYWIVTVDGARLSYARCGNSSCGEVLCHITWADELECLLNRIKPAHTKIKLSYA